MSKGYEEVAEIRAKILDLIGKPEILPALKKCLHAALGELLNVPEPARALNLQRGGV